MSKGPMCVIALTSIAMQMFIALSCLAQSSECGNGGSLAPVANCSACEGTFDVHVIYATYGEVATSCYFDSTLPPYIDDLEFESFIDTLSLGKHDMEVDVMKRSGADSIYQWVLDLDPDTTTWTEMVNALDGILPGGYDDAEVLVYMSSAKLDGPLGHYNHAGGCACNATGRIYMFSGSVPPAGECIRYDQEWIQGMLVHEYGHVLGFNHLPRPENGSGPKDS